MLSRQLPIINLVGENHSLISGNRNSNGEKEVF